LGRFRVALHEDDDRVLLDHTLDTLVNFLIHFL
jgi:hypothetical protein